MRVLLIIEADIATTQLIERILSGCSNFGITYKKVYLSQLKTSDLFGCIPFFVRCGDPIINFWLKILAVSSIRYIYYIDDNFWKIQGDSALAKYYNDKIILSTLDNVVGKASLLLTNSDNLAKFLANKNSNVQVLPSFFDFSLIDQVEIIKTDEIRIGFAGSPSRLPDIEFLSDVVESILEKYDNVFFEFAGVMPSRLKISDHVRFFSHKNDYQEFIKFQYSRNWTVGLAPLIVNESNKCKTNNKYREYSACGTVGIFTNIAPYNSTVVNGETGILVDNDPEQWVRSITLLLQDNELRSTIARKAKNDVRLNYSVDVVSEYWANSFLENNYVQENKKLKLFFYQLYLSLFVTPFAHVKRYFVLLRITYKRGGLWLVFNKLLNKIR